MRVLHFVDAAGTDESFFKASSFIKVRVENDTSVLCHFANAGELVPDQIDITVTAGQADEVALKMAEYMSAGNVANGGVAKFIAGTAPLQHASAIEFTAGS
uniref:Uncharacterized protein n=1 Tax=Virus NIOZ-UU157 TaxID=2763269 RepID=A0A7S9SUY7_9VIRU|nr:MAG: hypothetical protein NIOZUU157_00390 [Virus NIOZ-UU157]